MRIILAILGVVLFAVVAVSTTSGSGPLAAGPAVAPRYTPMPAVAATPPDVGQRGARTYMRLWGMFALPIEGSEIPEDLELLPGAPRDYRGGIHEGIDFPAPAETPVLAAASGTVVRVDSSFLDWNREQQDIALYEALTLGYTPAATLDRIRGRQGTSRCGSATTSTETDSAATRWFARWVDSSARTRPRRPRDSTPRRCAVYRPH